MRNKEDWEKLLKTMETLKEQANKDIEYADFEIPNLKTKIASFDL